MSIDPADKLKGLRDKMNLSMSLLIDFDSATIRDYGVLNEEDGRIPHPAAFVIDREGIVRFRRVDKEYTKRPTIDEILSALAE